MSANQTLTNIKRLNVNLPESVYNQLDILARESGVTMTTVVRNALSLARIAYQEINNGNKLAVVSPTGTVIKEIVLVK